MVRNFSTFVVQIKDKETTKMSVLDKQQLEHGDLTKIANATGFSKDYVNRVLTGNRDKKSKGAKMIIAAFEKVIAHNKALEDLCAEIRHNAINDIEPALYGRENFNNTYITA